MPNDEARRNDEVRMTNCRASVSDAVAFRRNALQLFGRSPFVIRNSSALELSSNLARKERIVPFLLANRGHWPVSGTDDRLVRQGQDFLEIIS